MITDIRLIFQLLHFSGEFIDHLNMWHAEKCLVKKAIERRYYKIDLKMTTNGVMTKLTSAMNKQRQDKIDHSKSQFIRFIDCIRNPHRPLQH